jgi:hypothetical protein
LNPLQTGGNAEQCIRCRPNIENYNHCFGGNSGDINARTHDAGAEMLAEKFDPYGELLPDDAGGKAYVTKAASVLLSRVGQLVFWVLAIAIVCVRIRYFSAGL